MFSFILNKRSATQCMSALLLLSTFIACSEGEPDEGLSVVEQAATTCSSGTYMKDGVELYEREFYVFDQINKELAEDAGLRDFTGLSNVTTCQQARLFSEKQFEFLSLFPSIDAVQPVSHELYPFEEGLDTDDFRTVEQRIANGYLWNNSQTMELIIREGTGGSIQKQCTGTLIAEDVVLTAAHCIYASGRRSIAISTGNGGGKVLVFGNPSSTTTNATGHRHPNYSGLGDAGDDIGIFILDSVPNAPANSDSARTRLMVNKTWKDAPIRMYGYGHHSHSGVGSQIQRGGVNDVSWSGSKHFTANANTGASACTGDSGGPALRVASGDYRFQFGVFSELVGSYSDFCPYSSGYNRWAHVGPKISWIESKIGACSRHTSFTNSNITYAKCW